MLAAMTRLWRVDCSTPGLTRRRRGRGFSYAHPDGSTVTDTETLERIRDLAVPPAWSEVWICPWPTGHLQAVGTDAAGRRQYLYHDQWRTRRDREKFDRALAFGIELPTLRAAVDRDLRRAALDRARVLSAIVRLLDIGCFRIGGEEYALDHEAYGIASLRKDHVSLQDGALVFTYPAKASIERHVELRDASTFAVVAALRRRRSGGSHLFAFKQGHRWVEVHAPDVNDYIKDALGEQFSAKDFRTWSATVIAAVALAGVDPVPASPSQRRRAVNDAIALVARALGNTPAVSRASYVDPRVIDHFDDGTTIRSTAGHQLDLDLANLERHGRSDDVRRSIEESVIDLL